MMEKVDWSNARFADSKKFIEWLVEQTPGGMEELQDSVKHSARWARRVCAWKRGEYALIKVDTTLDEFTMYLDIPLWTIPDSVFTNDERSKRKRGFLKKEEIEHMLMVAEEKGIDAAARAINVTPETVRRHRRIQRGQNDFSVLTTA
jgi:hypothetical protein